MPTQAIIPVTPGSGLDLDAVSLVIGPNTVFREVLVIADPSNATYLATVNSDGTLNVALPSAQTPPSAAAIGTAVATDLLIGTQVAGSSVPVALPTATITALTPPTAAAIAAAIVANPPAVTVTGNVSVIGTDADNAANSTTKVPTIPARANASAPSWTEGHEVPLSVDLAGNLRVLASGAFTGNITEWNTTSLGSPTAFGTEPSGNVIGVNAEVFQGSSVVGSGNALYVQFPSAQAVTGTFFQATQPVSIASGQVASGAFASGSIASGAIASGAIASGAIAAGAAAAGAFADGSVFVRSNAASTFPVTASIVGHAGVTLDAVLGATKPANVLQVGGNDGTNAYAIPLASGGASVLVSGTVNIGSGPFTVVGNLTNNNAAPSTNNIGALTVLANAAAPTWTEGDLVTASADLAGNMRVLLHAETTKVIGTVNQGTSPWIVASNLTHNNAAPSTANLGVLSAVANAAAPTFTEGNQVLLSTDLAGNLRTSGTFTGTITGAVTGTLTNNNAAPSTNNIGALTILANAADPTWTEGDLVTASANLAGYQRVLLHAETTKVIGTVRATGNIGGVFDAVRGAAIPANAIQVGGSDGTDLQALRTDTSGRLEVVGAAANAASAAGNPVLIAGWDNNSDARTLALNNSGIICLGSNGSGSDGASNSGIAFPNDDNRNQSYTPIFSWIFNGTTWDRARSAGVGNAVAATGLAAAVGYVQYNTTLPAPTAGQYTAAQCDTTGSTYVNMEGRKATYSAFASFTAVAGDIAVLPGSASKTIRVIRVEVSFVTSGVAAIEAVQLIKRSAADTGGTSAAMTAVPHDSNFAGASAAPLNYTVAPTPGAAVGTIRGVQFNDASSSVPGANTWIWDFGARPSSAIVLRGVAQMLCIALPTAVATQTATVSFEWTEE